MAATDFTDRLQSAAAAACMRLEHQDLARWEVFAKASSTRESVVGPTLPLRTAQVEETGIAIRTVNRGETGFAAASGLEADASRRAVEGALSCAMPTAVDPLPPARLRGLSDTSPPHPLPAAGWAAHAGHQLETFIGRRGQGRLRLRRAVFQEGAFAWILSTEDGWIARHDGARSSLLVEIDVAGERTGAWREWLHIDNPENFDLEAAASAVADRALLLSHNVATDTGLRDLILHPEVAAELLAAVAPLFLARRPDPEDLAQLVDRNGRLAASALTLADDRCDAEAPVTGPCDGEGLPARRTVLVEGGVLRHRLASTRDAALCGEPLRGGALRLSYRDYPATGLANLKVDTSGGIHAGELLGAAERALYLLRPVAPVEADLEGDSYRIVASGVWLDGRKVRGWHPVVELRGSLGRLLRRIEAVGNDLRWFQTGRGFIGTPSVLVRRQRVVR